MSYDISLYEDPCDEHPIFHRNYTRNVSSAWRVAGIDFYDYDGRKARKMSKPLGKAIYKLLTMSEDFVKHDAPNDWGTVAQSVERFLIPIWRASVEHPQATVSVSA